MDQQVSKETMIPIFKSSSKLANMKKETFVVPQASSYEISKNFVLSKASQKSTVNKLVDRTPHWLDLEETEQFEEIKAALLLQTIAEYLYTKKYIAQNCTMFENGFDKDGNIVLDAFYVKDSKLQRDIEEEFKNKKVKNEEKKKGSVVSFEQFKRKKRD